MLTTAQDFQQLIIAAKEADPTLAELDSTSAVAIWLLWTAVGGIAAMSLNDLFAQHKSEVLAILVAQTPHTLQWYVLKAKAFQYGVALPAGSDVYSLVPPADASVLIIQNAAAIEVATAVRIKAARLSGGVLAALSTPQLTAFTAYMNRVKDAGVRLQCTSGAPDNLQLALNVHYDPLVLDNTGARVDGTSPTPVPDAINAFLDNLPFNGLFVLNSLVMSVQAVDGVRICQVISAQANYAAIAYVTIAYEYTPDAGYMVLDGTFFNSNVNYLAHGPI